MYAWWWWRGPNRPWISDRAYIDALDAIPLGSVGLDLGSRSRVRPDAITVDVVDADGVDLVADGHELPFGDSMFDYVWSNAVLEHVRNPFVVAAEIVRTLKPGGLAIVQVPFLESVHSWPTDYFRFTQNGLRELFSELEEVSSGVSCGPGQVLPDLLEYYATGLADVPDAGLAVNAAMVVVGTVLLPLRALDRVLLKRPAYWKWARAYYYIGRKPGTTAALEQKPTAVFVMPSSRGEGFEEVMRERTHDAVRALGRAGANVKVVDVDSARDRSSLLARAAISARPNLVLALNMNYYLEAAANEESLFRTSQAPVAMLWDDPLGALALRDLNRRGVPMGWLGEERGDDSLVRFREAMGGPRTRHFAWDSGHIAAVTGLDLVSSAQIEWYPIATYSPFLAQGRHEPPNAENDVAFCGNVYPHAVAESNFARDPLYAELTDRICAAKEADLSLPLWELLVAEIGRLPSDVRRERGLDPESSPFWDFYVYAVWLAGTTRVRLNTFGSVERSIDVFGVFGDPQSVGLLERQPNLVYRGNAHQARELPQVFAATKINICLSNGLIHSGVPSKLIDCLASGGFALVDPKPDLLRLFGPDIEPVLFRNGEELNAKIEYFLDRPGERREIVEMLRATVQRECTLERLFDRVLRTTI